MNVYKSFFIFFCFFSFIAITYTAEGIENVLQKKVVIETSDVKKNVKSPLPFLPATKYEFSKVLEGTVVTHNFIIKNKGSSKLEIMKVRTA